LRLGLAVAVLVILGAAGPVVALPARPLLAGERGIGRAFRRLVHQTVGGV